MKWRAIAPADFAEWTLTMKSNATRTMAELISTADAPNLPNTQLFSPSEAAQMVSTRGGRPHHLPSS